jgi:hypothetical protein
MEFERMKDFANASFSPDTIKVMTLAMNGALSALPHPVSSTHVQSVARQFCAQRKTANETPRFWSAWRCSNFGFRPECKL